MTGIYVITCKITFCSYVGLSTNIDSRWRQHHKRFNPELFTYEVLEECDKDSLNDREIFWINEYNSLEPMGFNKYSGGRHPKKFVKTKPPWNKGKTGMTYPNRKRPDPFTEEHRTNMSKSRGPRGPYKKKVT